MTGLALGALVALAAYLLFAHFPDFPRQGFVRWTDERGKVENLPVCIPARPHAGAGGGRDLHAAPAGRPDLHAAGGLHPVGALRRGCRRRRILVRDALRPSTFSLITVAGVALGRLIGGTAIVEAIFNLPGMGTLIIDSVGAKDFRVVQGAVLVIAVFYVIINAIIDISYAYIDPRIRRGRT